MGQFKILGAVALGVLTASTQVLARSDRPFGDDYYVDAKVVRVAPIVRVVQVATPREVCWDERVRHIESHGGGYRDATLPVIVGGVLGGVVGNQIGRRRHRGALTIAGSVIGAAVGHNVSQERQVQRPRRRSYTTTERHCEIETDYRDEERIEGYDVTYRYNGRYFTTRTDHEPGKRIRVRVQVEPASGDEYVTRSEHRFRRDDHFCREDCFDT